MKFEEKDYIRIESINDTFVYFLLDGDEVVYVGQTRNGLSRIYAHKKNKKFDGACVIYCDSLNLDYMEDFYITKYKPKYNKIDNKRWCVPIGSAVYRINDDLNIKENCITKKKLLSIINKLGIKIHTINCSMCISEGDLYEIECKVAYGYEKEI